MNSCGRISVNLLYLDAMRLEGSQVFYQVHKAEVAVKGRCEMGRQ